MSITNLMPQSVIVLRILSSCYMHLSFVGVDAIFRVKEIQDEFDSEYGFCQVVETSVANNSPSQASNHPDDLFQSRYVTLWTIFLITIIAAIAIVNTIT